MVIQDNFGNQDKCSQDHPPHERLDPVITRISYVLSTLADIQLNRDLESESSVGSLHMVWCLK